MGKGRKVMPPGPGRPKGLKNKATKNAKEAIARFVDGNSDRLNGWLDEIYASDGPKAAFQCFSDLLEYHVPKLSRTENQSLDKDGNPADNHMKVSFVGNTDTN